MKKAIIDTNLGNTDKAIRDLQRAIASATELLKHRQIYSALYTIETVINKVQRDLLNKKTLSSCKRTSSASGNKSRPLKKPGTNA